VFNLFQLRVCCSSFKLLFPPVYSFFCKLDDFKLNFANSWGRSYYGVGQFVFRETRTTEKYWKFGTKPVEETAQGLKHFKETSKPMRRGPTESDRVG